MNNPCSPTGYEAALARGTSRRTAVCYTEDATGIATNLGSIIGDQQECIRVMRNQIRDLDQLATKLGTELADANDQLKAYKLQLEHLDKLRAAAVAADVVFHQRDSGEWEATTPVTLHKSLDELMRIEKLNALLAAHDQDVIKLRAKLADTEEQLLVMKACAEGAQHELARVYDQARRIGDERTELKVKLASERSRNTELSGQVNVAGALGVRWTWEGGVCKAHLDQSGLRDQLQRLADFHNKVAKLVNG